MKKLFFVMAACAAICACNTKEDIVKPNIDDQFSGDAAYLTVRIKDAGAQTRADKGGFAYGTEKEQYVRTANFYFYDDEGNYITYGTLGRTDGTASSGDTAGNIEWESGTVVTVWGLTDETAFPTKMVTVLNQPSDFIGMTKSLDEMTAALAKAGRYGDDNGYSEGNGYFVMSTSVYSNNGVVNYTALTKDNFAKEPINIEADYTNGDATPVDVYVERLAVKVGINLNSQMGDGGTGTLESTTINDYTAYNFTSIAEDQFMDGYINADQPLYVAILGWDIDATARDSYMLKNMADNSNWSGLTWVWNDATNHRSYWAESPNYGDATIEYPTSSLGNTDDDERPTYPYYSPLNEYLKYTSLKSPIAIDEYGYCGENTNTVEVLGDESSTAITNAIIKAQAYTVEDNEYVPLDIVEYHGEYYTAADFCQKCVDDVVEYDFTVLVDEVISALKEKYSDYADYLDELNAAVIHDYIYKTPVNSNSKHKYGAGVSVPNEFPASFGGEMLSLYNAYDGKVKIFYNGAQPYYGEAGDNTGTAVEPELYASYPASDIVYGGEDLDDYDFWFHIDSAELGTLEKFGLTELGLLYQMPTSSGEYFMPIDNSISFTTESTGDDSYTGGHTYTTRNFLLRAITVEADGINTEFGSIYPNYFADGLMYYHTPIEHLGTTSGDSIVEGQYGVVRNHWYNITVNYFSHLGRGIAVEDEVIVPQPELEYWYLGTDVNILSWQMINQTVGF